MSTTTEDLVQIILNQVSEINKLNQIIQINDEQIKKCNCQKEGAKSE